MDDNRLIQETTFAARFPDFTACSASAGGEVNSALTPSKYIRYDWSTGQYVTEAR